MSLFNLDDSSGRLRRIALGLIASAALIVGAGDLLIAVAGPDSRSPAYAAGKYFWADGEGNLWSWYSGFVLGLVAVTFFLLAARARSHELRRAYGLLAAVALLMSADEVAQLHELLRHGASVVGLGRIGWLALGVPLGLIAAVLLFLIARPLDAVLRRRLVVAGAVFLLGAIGVESTAGLILGPLAIDEWEWPFILEVTVEEGLEFTGALLALVAALRLLESRATITPPAAERVVKG